MSASPDPFRVALLGYGLAGAVFHAPLIAATPGLRLDAIVTAHPERIAQASREHPQTRRLPDADALWRESGRYDLAVIATPNRLHVPLAQAALERGLAVVIDKPFALDVAAGAALIEQAQRCSGWLSVFQNRRWDGDWLTLRALVAAGALGELHRLESRFERWRPQPRPGWRQSAAPEDGGGVLFDLGSHLVDQALQLGGAARRVVAQMHRRHPDARVDDDSHIAIEHDGGLVSQLWMSSMAADAGPRLRALGSHAAYVKHHLDPQEDALRAGARPPAPDWGREAPERWGERVAGERRERVPTQVGDYPAFYAQVVHSLREGAPPPVAAQDCLDALRVLEAARRSAREARVVALD